MERAQRQVRQRDRRKLAGVYWRFDDSEILPWQLSPTGFRPASFRFYSGQGGLPLSEEPTKRVSEELWNFRRFTKTTAKALLEVVEIGNVAKLTALYNCIRDKVYTILSECSELNCALVELGSL